MTPKRTFSLLILITRKNLRSSVLSEEAMEDHLSDVVGGVIEVKPEGEKEDRTGTQIMDNLKVNATVVGWKTITYHHVTSSSSYDSHFFTSGSTLMRE